MEVSVTTFKTWYYEGEKGMLIGLPWKVTLIENNDQGPRRQ